MVGAAGHQPVTQFAHRDAGRHIDHLVLAKHLANGREITQVDPHDSSCAKSR
jgi:hypothetical protein